MPESLGHNRLSLHAARTIGLSMTIYDAFQPNLSARRAVFVTASELAVLQAGATPPVVLAVWAAETDSAVPRAGRPRIPGALDTDLATEFASAGGGLKGSRPLPDIADLQRNARRWGIDADSTVVVYDIDGALQASRAWWTLRWAGVARVLLLDGGFDAWQAAGLPVADRAPEPAPGNVTLSAGHMPQLTAGEAIALARSGVLLDTRIAPNYAGGPVAPGEPARGHIPGAVSVPAAANLGPDRAFLGATGLAALYDAAGVEVGRPVGIYCGAGVSAAHAVAALATLGITAPMYVGSWSAYSADPARPVATGTLPG
jgi:thiosulfate/3-mercaptopyruvate sulfurtransferase